MLASQRVVLSTLVALISGAASGCGRGGSSGNPEPDAADLSTQPTAGEVAISSDLAEDTDEDTIEGGAAAARFSLTDLCTLSAVAGCIVSVCPTDPALASAGTITITGAGAPIELDPQSNNSYPEFGSDMPLFSGGESLQIVATGSGSGIGAFSGTVIAPAKVTLTTPVKSSDGTLAVDRAQPLSFAWSGTSAGTIDVSLVSGGATTVLDCGFEASAGSGTIAPEALAMLGSGSNGSFSINSQSVLLVKVDTLFVELAAIFPDVWPDDTFASGQMIVQ